MSTPGRPRTGRQRGTTLTGYALTVSLFVAVGLIAMQQLEDNSGEFLTDTGDSIGAARPDREYLATSILEPVPTTSSTTAPPTTTTTTVASSTTSPPTTAPPTTASTTTTTAAPPVETLSVTDPAVVLSGYTVAGGAITSTAADALDSPSFAQTATFTFTVGSDGTYKIGGIVNSNGSGSDNSFWVTVDGVDYKWGTPTSSGFVADFVNDDNGGSPDVTLGPFTAGETVTVTVSNREDGAQLQSLGLVLV